MHIKKKKKVRIVKDQNCRKQSQNSDGKRPNFELSQKSMGGKKSMNWEKSKNSQKKEIQNFEFSQNSEGKESMKYIKK